MYSNFDIYNFNTDIDNLSNINPIIIFKLVNEINNNINHLITLKGIAILKQDFIKLKKINHNLKRLKHNLNNILIYLNILEDNIIIKETIHKPFLAN